jgi:hypothetical protein
MASFPCADGLGRGNCGNECQMFDGALDGRALVLVFTAFALLGNL